MKQSKLMGWIGIFFFLMILPIFAGKTVEPKEWLKMKHEVVKASEGNRLVINYKGLVTTVKLAFVEPIGSGEQAKNYLKELIGEKEMIFLPEPSLGLGQEGTPQVYAFIQSDSKKKLFINEELLRQGYATLKEGEAKFSPLYGKLKKMAANVKPKAGYHTGNTFFSELNSKRYCKDGCKWVKMMNKQSRITYDGFEAAEAAGKKPCSLCLYERVRDLRAMASGGHNVEKLKEYYGQLWGIKEDKSFYSPVSKKFASVELDDIVVYKSLTEAIEDGKKADHASLRIDNPVVPGPRKGECIGRALPFFRPCRRAHDSHPTHLCEPCRNGRIR